MVLSQLPDSTRVPSTENATEKTRSECPSKLRISAPVAASHSLMVLSQLPDSARAPSAENAADMTTLGPSLGTISIFARSCAQTGTQRISNVTSAMRKTSLCRNNSLASRMCPSPRAKLTRQIGQLSYPAEGPAAASFLKSNVQTCHGEYCGATWARLCHLQTKFEVLIKSDRACLLVSS